MSSNNNNHNTTNEEIAKTSERILRKLRNQRFAKSQETKYNAGDRKVIKRIDEQKKRKAKLQRERRNARTKRFNDLRDLGDSRNTEEEEEFQALLKIRADHAACQKRSMEKKMKQEKIAKEKAIHKNKRKRTNIKGVNTPRNSRAIPSVRTTPRRLRAKKKPRNKQREKQSDEESEDNLSFVVSDDNENNSTNNSPDISPNKCTNDTNNDIDNDIDNNTDTDTDNSTNNNTKDTNNSTNNNLRRSTRIKENNSNQAIDNNGNNTNNSTKNKKSNNTKNKKSNSTKNKKSNSTNNKKNQSSNNKKNQSTRNSTNDSTRNNNLRRSPRFPQIISNNDDDNNENLSFNNDNDSYKSPDEGEIIYDDDHFLSGNDNGDKDVSPLKLFDSSSYVNDNNDKNGTEHDMRNIKKRRLEALANKKKKQKISKSPNTATASSISQVNTVTTSNISQSKTPSRSIKTRSMSQGSPSRKNLQSLPIAQNQTTAHTEPIPVDPEINQKKNDKKDCSNMQFQVHINNCNCNGLKRYRQLIFFDRHQSTGLIAVPKIFARFAKEKRPHCAMFQGDHYKRSINFKFEKDFFNLFNHKYPNAKISNAQCRLDTKSFHTRNGFAVITSKEPGPIKTLIKKANEAKENKIKKKIKLHHDHCDQLICSKIFRGKWKKSHNYGNHIKQLFENDLKKDCFEFVLIMKMIGLDGKITYDIPGGKRRLGETSSQCAIRETEEETSLKLIDANLLGLRKKHLFVNTFFIIDAAKIE